MNFYDKEKDYLYSLIEKRFCQWAEDCLDNIDGENPSSIISIEMPAVGSDFMDFFSRREEFIEHEDDGLVFRNPMNQKNVKFSITHSGLEADEEVIADWYQIDIWRETCVVGYTSYYLRGKLETLYKGWCKDKNSNILDINDFPEYFDKFSEIENDGVTMEIDLDDKGVNIYYHHHLDNEYSNKYSEHLNYSELEVWKWEVVTS